MLLSRALRGAAAVAIVGAALACAQAGAHTSEECKPGEDAISWDRALALLEAGEVVGGGQTHSGHVFLELRDGRTLVTVQPRIDQIYDEIELRAPNAREIHFWTE